MAQRHLDQAKSQAMDGFNAAKSRTEAQVSNEVERLGQELQS